jgi:flagellar hook-associated protein 3 FlgL
MRIANKSIYDAVTFQLGNITDELARANEVVATTKRINSLSDDPVGLNQVLSIKSSLSNIEQLERNITMGKTWLTAGESALTNVQDLLTDTKALCIQMASANIGDDERRSAADAVQNTLDELVSLANTQVNGRYVFAGSDTDNTPFDSSGSYSGDNNPFSVKVGKDATVEIGGDGEDVFKSSGNDLFQTLADLVTALQGGDVPGIQNAITNLESNFNYIGSKIADLGSKVRRMEMKENILAEIEISTTERKSKLEDADIAEAILVLKAKETAYQAALAASSTVLKVSLVDYM